jgi:serine/threonine protein kinase
MQDTATSATNRPRELPAAPPEKIWKYQIQGEIGRGACGVVYKGFDPFVQRDVAIKVAVPDAPALTQLAAVSLRTTGAKTRDSFFKEARAAGMLHHPHIVALYDAGTEGELSFLVMEYIDGETLLPLCRKKGPRAPLDQVLDIVFKCARALDFAHSKGVLHRDVKPSNIMITRDGVPKIMDFSIAEITAAPSAVTDTVVGSPPYMSPEQIQGEPLGPASDLYSLGAVMFHLLTGEAPFVAPDTDALFDAILKKPAPRVSDFRPDIPVPVAEVVTRLLQKRPVDRYPNGQTLANVLTRLFDRLKFAEQQVSRREHRNSLRNLRFFDGFSDEEIDEILTASSMTNFRTGDTIIKEAEIDNAFFILALGTAEVRKGGNVVSMLTRGDCFGEMSFLASAKRTASVVATSDVLAIKVTAALIEQVSRDCQLRFYKVFTETLVYRLTATTAKLSAQS